jgi:hypothetical protein
MALTAHSVDQILCDDTAYTLMLPCRGCAGWNGLLEDGQPCLSDWACCSGKCSENTCKFNLLLKLSRVHLQRQQQQQHGMPGPPG